MAAFPIDKGYTITTYGNVATNKLGDWYEHKPVPKKELTLKEKREQTIKYFKSFRKKL